MELNGTLHEYLLADVFQLLAQQKATGRLEVRDGERVGFMVLNEGMIVFAQEDADNVQSKIGTLLKQLRRVPEKDLQKLLSLHTNSPARFIKELVTREAATEQEMSMAVRATVEDIACSLFSWSRGTYRFDSLNTVRQYVVPGIVLPADSVVMEAMRRDDEAKRLFGQLADDAILVPTSREHGLGAFPRSLSELFHSPDSFILSFVDGLTSVGTITKESGLSEYRACEALVRLWQSNLVAPLPARLSESIKAAMNMKEGRRREGMGTLALAVSGSLLAVIVIVFAGLFVFQGVLMRNKAAQSSKVRTEVELTEAKQKVEAAKLQYHAEHGRRPAQMAELVDAGYLTLQDIAPLAQPRSDAKRPEKTGQ